MEVFVFGSALKHWPARDFDILLVYDGRVVPATDAHQRVASFVKKLEQTSGAPVHLTLLSISEERSIAFVASEKCVPFREWNAAGAREISWARYRRSARPWG